MFTLSKLESIKTQYGSLRNVYDLNLIETIKYDCNKWKEMNSMFSHDKELQATWKKLTKDENLDLIKSVLNELNY